MVQDGDKTIKFKSKLNVVKEILKENNISYKKTDIIEPTLDSEVNDLATIKIIRSKNIVFINGGNKSTVSSTAATVAEFLKEQKIELTKDDIINVSLESALSEKTPIKIDYVTYENVVETETIAFKKIEEESDKLAKGETKVDVKGVDGTKEIKRIQKYVNGKLIETYDQSRSIVKKPIDEKVLMGTKEEVADSSSSSEEDEPIEEESTEDSTEASTDGSSDDDTDDSDDETEDNTADNTEDGDDDAEESDDYILMTATAYNIQGTTASGMASGFGKVAVDPNVIPLGTQLRIESTDSWPSYGYAVAADTGGDIQGNRIDLFYDSYDECIQFGRREVKVYIID